MMKKKVKPKKVKEIKFARCCQDRCCHFCGSYIEQFKGETFWTKRITGKHIICRSCQD